MKINKDIFNSPNVKDGTQKTLQFTQSAMGRQRLGRKATVDLKNIPTFSKKMKLKRQNSSPTKIQTTKEPSCLALNPSQASTTTNKCDIKLAPVAVEKENNNVWKQPKKFYEKPLVQFKDVIDEDESVRHSDFGNDFAFSLFKTQDLRVKNRPDKTSPFRGHVRMNTLFGDITGSATNEWSNQPFNQN